MLTKDKKTSSPTHISTFFVAMCAVLAFLIPTNLFVKVIYPGARVSGLIVDYLLPKFYLSDLALLGILMLGLLQFKTWSKHIIVILLLFCGFAITHIFLHRFDPTLPSTVWMFIKWFAVLACGLICIEHKNSKHQTLMAHPWIHWALVGAIFFQTTLGIYQHVFQRPLVGFYFFGEPPFESSMLFAKTENPGALRMLPYGTTPHPNVLAGVSVLMFFVLMTQTATTLFTQLAGVCVLMIICATQSTVALCALFFGFGWKTFMNVVGWKMKTKLALTLTVGALFLIISPFALASLAPHFPSSTSLNRRVQLNTIGWHAFLAHPFEGVGVNAFTAREHEFGEVVSSVRFIQPAHHIPLLFLAETGFLGILFIFLFFIFVHKYYSVNFAHALFFTLPLSLIFSLDHYVYTLQQGQLVFIFILILLLEKRKITSPQARKFPTM